MAASWTQRALAYLLVLYLAALLTATVVVMHTQLERAQESAEDYARLLQPAPDFQSIDDIPTRKQVFFDFMRPLVAHQNTFYQRERERLQAIIAKLEQGDQLNSRDKRKVTAWSEMLDLPEALALEEQIELLQLRLHGIPEAMVLAQAAAESAWGQSRFARDANNFFGQWCYTPGCGLVPLRRAASASHEVRHFESALAAVQSYFRNINSHRAYRSLREKRLRLEQAGEDITAIALVEELVSYSERGEDYTRELQQIIRGNDLE